MCKYEMDPVSIVEDTERARFGLETDGWADGRTDGLSETSIPLNFIGGWYNYTNVLEIFGPMSVANTLRHRHIDRRVNASRRAEYTLDSVSVHPCTLVEIIGLLSLLYDLDIFTLKSGQREYVVGIQPPIIKRIVGILQAVPAHQSHPGDQNWWCNIIGHWQHIGILMVTLTSW